MKKLITLLTLMFPFIISAQNITSISPLSATQGESIVLSITGSNTFFTAGVKSIKLALASNNSIYVNATSINVINDTLLKAAFTLNTNSTIGKYDVIVDNYTLPTAFSLNKTGTAILSVTPQEAAQMDSVELTIKSFNTYNTQATYCNVTLQKYYGSIIYPFKTTIIDEGTIKCKFAFTYTDYLTDYDVVLSNSVVSEIRLASGFKLKKGPFPPQLISISPNVANRMDSVLLTIKGKNTFFLKDSNTFFLNNYQNSTTIAPKKINYINDTTATAFFVFYNSYRSGKYDLIINTNTSVLLSAFTLNDALIKPAILSFDPVYSKQGDSVLITVKGRNTHFLSGNGYLNLYNNNGTISPQSVKVIHDSLLQAKFVFNYLQKDDYYQVQGYDLMDGQLTSADPFTLNPGDRIPVLKSITPISGVQGVDMKIQFNGNKDLLSLFGFYRVEFVKNNRMYSSYRDTILNDSTFKASFHFPNDTAAVGTYDINVYNGYLKKISLKAGFTLNKSPNPSEIISVTPSSATQFDTVLVSVKGSRTHFLWPYFDVYLQPSNNVGFAIQPKERNVVNDTVMTLKFILNVNYYPSVLYDMVINSQLDGNMIKKSAFTINRIYTQEPKIIDINPKNAAQGESITLMIKGTKQSFTSGPLEVKLFNSVISIPAASVTYINDSLISADFPFNNGEPSSMYVLAVNNRISIVYYSFYLKPTSISILSVDPPWADQTDSIKLRITGSQTHFNLTDSVWLKDKYGMSIRPFLVQVTNDTLTTAHFAFKKNNLPGKYTTYLKSNTDNVLLSLPKSFTLTGVINNTALLDVNPKYSGCYMGGFKTKFTVYAKGTHFLSEVDTVIFGNTQNNEESVYPSEIKIIDDTTLTADVNFANSCGIFDVLVSGKENYILSGRIMVSPPVSIAETPKEPFKIFPNPSEGIFTLELNETFEQADVIVVDVLGKIVFSEKKLEASTQIDLSDYPAGMYFIKLVKDNVFKTEKIIKQ
jgi:hypothetical protein